MAHQKQKPEWWTNRIIQYGEMPANQFLAHEMNARRHPAKQREALRGSLDSVGWIAPVLVSARTGKTLNGHARIEEALSRDEMMRVPYVEIDVSEAEERLILATLDPITELATYDKAALDSLLREVETGNAALMEMLSKQAEEHGLLPLSGHTPGAGGDDFDATPEETQTRVEYGDLWQCGEHRVLCGDSTKAEDVARVMSREKAAMMWTDPPYGVSYVGKTVDALTIANDGADGLPVLLRDAFARASDALEAGSPFYIAHPPGALCLTFGQAILEAGWRFHQTLIWCKDSMVLGHSDYHFQHEPIYYGWTAGEGRSGRGNHDGSRWRGDHSQVSVFHVARPKRSDDHPTSKPVGLVIHAIQNSSLQGDCLYEPFGGSGTTLIACERTNRKARVIEIEPKYVNVILSRWEAETGKTAQLLERVGVEVF